MNENIGNFDVSVDDLVFIEVDESLEDVPDVSLCLSLRKILLFSEFGLQIALVAELGDDVAIAVAGKDVKAPKHARMVQLLQHVDLREKQFL